MGILQGLCDHDGFLYALWKGETGDDRLFWSALVEGPDNTSVWQPQQAFGGNSSHGPSAAALGNTMVVAWKGEFGDERLFYLTVGSGGWSQQQDIPNVASSHGPSLAAFGQRVYAAWKGRGSDQAMYWSYYVPGQPNASWAQQQLIPNVATAVGPSLAAYNGKLYAAWRGWANDERVFYASFDGVSWSPQALLPGAGSSTGPALTAVGDSLYAVWKGVTGDETLWWAAFDGTKWSQQQPIPGVASSVGAALTQHNGRLAAMWKGADADQGLYYTFLVASRWQPQQRLPGNTGQDTPQNIGLRMQWQQTSQWCWLAVGCSVSHFYGAPAGLTQCSMMTQIGQAINKWPSTVICCPTVTIDQANPNLVGDLLNPYDPDAHLCLDSVGIPQVCIKSGGVGDALNVNGNTADSRTSMSLDDITAEIQADRPVVVGIQLSTTASHYVAIAGALNDLLLISDPDIGESVISYESLTTAGYRSGATVNFYQLTKPT